VFTGIIEEVGAVSRRSGSDVTILAETVLDGLQLGDSIAVDGVCLTVAHLAKDSFTLQLSPETLSRSTLGNLKPGAAVNLERSMTPASRFGGHFVQGHVDGVGRIAAVKHQGDFSLWTFQAPADVAKYLVPKGSVAINGISLTVVDPRGDSFDVAIIPVTVKKTTLGSKRAGDAVNMEADMLGKHIYHYMQQTNRGAATLDSLKRQGYA